MNQFLPALVAAALLAPAPAFADEAVVTLDHRQLAAADDTTPQADAWKRWAEDYARDMRTSMGTMFGARMGPHKLVKAAPYSAEVITETNQSLADGNVITRKTQGSVYRDGEGRTRQETPGDGKQSTIFISDPVAGTNVVLTPGSKRAIVARSATPEASMKKEKQVVIVNGREVKVEDGAVFVDGKEILGGKTEVVAGGTTIRVENGKVTIDGRDVKADPAGKGSIDRVVVKTIEANESPDGTVREEVRVQVVRAGDGIAPPAPMPPVPPTPPVPPGAYSAPLAPQPPMPGVQTLRFESPARLGKGVTTNLGNKDFDGVKAEGKSTVWTIAAGEIGNKNAINVTSESWYSPELQLTVYSRYNDPRTGETLYRLAGIRRGEPSADLFRIPAGYQTKRRDRDTPRPH